MRLTALALTISLIAFPFAGVANGDIVFEDNYNNNGPLLGTTPGVGGVWTLNNSLVNPLTVTGNILGLMNNGQDAYGAFSNAVPNSAGNGVYSGLDINISAAQAAGDYFFHLSDPVGTNSFFNRLFARSSGAGFQLGIVDTSGTGSTVSYGSGVLNFNQNYRVVTSWSFVAGTQNDVFSIYVDPTDPNQAGNTAYLGGHVWTSTSVQEPLNVSSVNFRQGSAANAPTLTTDNLTVGTTFAEAARLVVPEPGMAGLALFALVGMTGLIRRRSV